MSICELLFTSKPLPDEIKMAVPNIDCGRPFWFPNAHDGPFYSEPVPKWALDKLDGIKTKLPDWFMYPFDTVFYPCPAFGQPSTWEREKIIMAKDFAFFRKMIECGSELLYFAIQASIPVPKEEDLVFKEINLNDYDFIMNPPDSFHLDINVFYRFVLK